MPRFAKCLAFLLCASVAGASGFSWQPPLPTDPFPVLARPAKGAAWTTPYGLTEVRVTDHAVEIPGSSWLRNDYSRREPFNADDSIFVGNQSDGSWDIYDVPAWTFHATLNGPGGDAEIQWDSTDPHVLYYLPTNGGTVLYRLDVTTNTSTIQYDFGADAQAALNLAQMPVHCWTKSEGSPSRDGRLWGLMCEDISFAPLGYVVLDVVNHAVVWSTPNSIRPDHVSMSPSGRWFVRSGDDALGTVAYAIDGSGRSVQLHHKSEHSDIGVLPNGDDFYISVDYETNDGDIFSIDIDAGESSRRVLYHAYNTPWVGDGYSIHFSGKAYAKPGYALAGHYNNSNGKSNIVIVDVVTGALYAVGLNYASWADYFDEPHGVPDRELTRIAVNGNFGHSLDDDVYEIAVPALPGRGVAAASYYTLTPCRAVDTRRPDGPSGGPALAGNGVRQFTVPGACGIPASAGAVSANVTITQPAAAGDLRIYPGNESASSTSVINFGAGSTRANNAILQLATDGSGTIAVQHDAPGTVHFVLDVNGYFQ